MLSRVSLLNRHLLKNLPWPRPKIVWSPFQDLGSIILQALCSRQLSRARAGPYPSFQKRGIIPPFTKGRSGGISTSCRYYYKIVNNPVAAGVGEQSHDGRVHPHFACDHNCSGPDQNHSRPETHLSAPPIFKIRSERRNP